MQVITDRDNERHITTKWDLFARLSLSAGALVSAIVWALALIKIAELCGLRSPDCLDLSFNVSMPARHRVAPRLPTSNSDDIKQMDLAYVKAGQPDTEGALWFLKK